MSELVLQLPLLGDVPQGEHDAAHGRVVPEVARGHLDIEAVAIGALDLEAAGAGRGPAGPHSEQRALGVVVVAGRDEVEDACPHHGTRAENRLRRRAGVPDAAAVVHDQDDIVGVLHERPEVRLVVAPDYLLAQRHPLEREGGLRCENLESAAEGEEHCLACGDDEQPHRGSGGGLVNEHERARQHRPEPLQLPGGCTIESVHVYEPARPVRGVRSGTEQSRGRAVGEQHRTVSRARGKQAPDSRLDGLCHIGGVGGRDQVVTGRTQDALTLDRLPVPCHHPRQPRQNEQEQDGGRRGDHRSVLDAAGERISEERARGDERHRHEQRDAPDAHLARRPPYGDREIGHRRMQGRGTPCRVEESPAEIVGVADRVRTAELFEAVADVGHEEAGRAHTE